MIGMFRTTLGKRLFYVLPKAFDSAFEKRYDKKEISKQLIQVVKVIYKSSRNVARINNNRNSGEFVARIRVR